METVSVLCKVVLANSSNIHQKAAVLHTAVGPTDSKLADAMLKAQKQYAEKRCGQTRHSHGLPRWLSSTPFTSR